MRVDGFNGQMISLLVASVGHGCDLDQGVQGDLEGRVSVVSSVRAISLALIYGSSS